MEDVFYEALASGDILVDINGTPLNLDLDFGLGEPGSGSAYWKDPVETVDDLPIDSNVDGDVRLVRADKTIHTWDGDSWEQIGSSVSFSTFWKDPVVFLEDLPTEGNATADMRYVQGTNRVYTWTGVEWKPLADNSGSGAAGSVPSVEFRSDLDAIVDPELGDMYLVRDENAIYVWDEVMVEKEPVQSWRILHADADLKMLNLGQELQWLDAEGNVGGSFVVRDVDITPHSGSFPTDPEWPYSNYDGLYWYAPGDPSGSLGGFEPWRDTNVYSGDDARVEQPGVDIGKRFVLSTNIDILSDEWTTLSLTAGNRINSGETYFYAELNRFSGKLSLYRVTTAFNARTVLTEVILGVPAIGQRVSLRLAREHNVIHVTGGYGETDGSNWTEQELTYTDGDIGYTFFGQVDGAPILPGLGAMWSDVGSFRFVEAYFNAYAVRREVVLRVNEEGEVGTSYEIILANSDVGWLLVGEGGEPGGGGGSAHVIEQAEGGDLPQRRAIRPEQQTGQLARLYTYDDSGNNASRIGVAIDEPKLKNEVKNEVKKQTGGKTGFKAVGLSPGYSHAVVEEDPDVPGPRYVLSYQFDGGWTKFRGFFEASVAGSALIGEIDEEAKDFRPPHTVRGVGVRDDGNLASIQVDADGKIYYSSAQVGRNYMDGFEFYCGKGPVVVIGTFIPDPDNPYYGSYGIGIPQTIVMKGAGLFEFPRDTDEGLLSLPDFPPNSEGYDGWSLHPDSQITWTVIDGDDIGQTGTLSLGNGIDSTLNGTLITIPSGLDGQVRITFSGFRWYEWYNI